MPFVDPSHRKNPNPTVVGDLCYQYYKAMIDTWNMDRRWTTAHNIYMTMRLNTNKMNLAQDLNSRTAYELAWQVFFAKKVLPYEDEKEKLNGTI